MFCCHTDIPNSGLVVDECGVCGGDNSTCVICADELDSVVFKAVWHDCEDDREFTIVPIQLGPGETAADFYSYDAPIAFSANTGLEMSNAEVLAFVINDIGQISLIDIHDAPADGSGGRVSLEIDTLNVAGRGAEIQVRDDTFAKDPRDGPYFWNSATGHGSFSWVWDPCCTDGFALGPIPFKSCLQLKYNRLDGLDRLLLATAHNNSIKFIEIPIYTGKALKICSCCDCPKFDECGVCRGDDSTCTDCAGIVNGPNEVDACGLCLNPDGTPGEGGEIFNKSCAGTWHATGMRRVCDARSRVRVSTVG